MIRPDPHREGVVSRLRRRQFIRAGLLGSVGLFLAECGGFFTGIGTFLPGFFRPLKAEAFGGKVAAGTPDDIKAWFKDKNDEPLLNVAGRFFIVNAPEGILALYRKCTHLGCTVPWNASEDQFHCPCHGSLFNKKTGVNQGGPAPRPLNLFPITVEDGVVTVDTNPTEGHLIVRDKYDPKQATQI